jgi:hypothetical protein
MTEYSEDRANTQANQNYQQQAFQNQGLSSMGVRPDREAYEAAIRTLERYAPSATDRATIISIANLAMQNSGEQR